MKKMISILVEPEQLEKASEIASQSGIKRAELYRRAIEHYLGNIHISATGSCTIAGTQQAEPIVNVLSRAWSEISVILREQSKLSPKGYLQIAQVIDKACKQ